MKIAVLTAATLAALSACSSSGSTPGTPRTGLAAALASVSATTATEDEFQYGDLKRQHDLGILKATGAGTTADHTWNAVAGYGTGTFGDLGFSLQRLTKLDPLTGTSALTVGVAPNIVTRIDGKVDADAVKHALTGLGAQKRTFAGTQGLSFGADDTISTSGALAGVGLVDQLDQVVVSGQSFTASPNARSLVRASGKGTSLLDTGSYRAVAACLGDVIAADIVATAKGNAAVIAVGVRDPGTLAGPRPEVVCFAPAKGKELAVTSALRTRLALSATDPVTGARVSTLLSAVHVDTSDGLVRATLTPRSSLAPGYVFTALRRGVASVWDGTCTSAPQPNARC